VIADALAIRASLLALLARRDPEASICPSEVARALAPQGDWRSLMGPVREVAQSLAQAGVVVITQGQAPLPPKGPFHGPIRVRRGPGF
jgi:hypothetical protein